MTSNPDNLPQLLPDTISLSDPPEITIQNATLENTRHSDLTNLQNAFKIVHASWQSVNSIASVCKLVDATVKLIETRRHTLGLEYGAPVSRSKGDIIFPLP